MQWLEDNTSTIMMLAAMLIVLTLMMRRVYRYRQRQRREETRGRKQNSALHAQRPPVKSLAGAPDDIVRWQVQLHEMARDIQAEIDTKLRLLQTLTVQARQAAAELNAALDRAREERERSG